MKVLLMHRDRDFDLKATRPPNEPDLTQDLELETLWRAMADDDPFLAEVARTATLSSLHADVDTIIYRQNVLRDCLKNPEVVHGIYSLAVETLELKKRHWFGIFTRYPTSILSTAIDLMEMFVGKLKELRSIADTQRSRFAFEGFTNLFAMLQRELSDDYLETIQSYLSELRFTWGILVSAELGKGNQGTGYVLRKSNIKEPNWFERILGHDPPGYTFHIDPRDEAGATALGELRNRGVNLVANALAQSSDHVLSFFTTLQTELAFYVGCLNLHAKLVTKGEPVCFPTPTPASERVCSFTALYDVCLTLTMEARVVGNSVDATGKSLVVITGANRGGKSTFLRSIGVAQLMMQSGSFVGAEAFSGAICPALFTHHKREEDASMKSGKFDEELARMSEIVDHLQPESLLLFNESFAATNEREGSEIAGQIVRALLENRIKIFFVTHLYALAHGLAERKSADAIFLRADRRTDETRSFCLVEGEPLETSYGEDLYRAIFAAETDTRIG